MKKIKIGQIGIGRNHGEGKMLAVRKFPELFEVIGYAEENEEWIEKRCNLPCYKDLPRLSVEEIIDKSDAILVECDVWNLTETAKMCIDAGKHVHIDKPASGTMDEFEAFLETAKGKKLTVQMGYMYRYNFAIQKLMEMINLGEPEKVYPFIKQTGFEGVYSDDNNFAVLEYDKAIARITNLSVEVNGWGMRRFAVMGSKGTVEIKPIELNVEMTKSTTTIATNAYQDMQEKVDVKDVPTLSRYDEMMKDFYKSVIGEKENPYSYEHELAVQRTLYKITGEN